jgi:hypothetical protein
MKKQYLNFLLALMLVISISLLIPGKGLTQAPINEMQVVIDHEAHQLFGLYYPVTYEFGIPGGASNLTAQYRLSQSGSGSSWTNLDTKTSSDFFNGVNAARFDYANNIAYLSVAFPLTSDVIYLRVLDGANQPVPLTFIEIPQYYDNRHAAVTLTLDDWDTDSGAYFNDASVILTNAHVHYTVGIITNADPNWSQIQSGLSTGYMEVASHARDHPCSAEAYEINGYDYQIGGSKEDILFNLALPYEYVPAYFEPCGYYSPQVRQAVVNAGYLVERGYPPIPVQNTFSDWDSDGAYARTLFSYSTYDWGYYDGIPDTRQERLDAANGSFDTAYDTGGIYHLLDHPWQRHWYSNDSLLSQHINHIKDKLDVWYAAFGELYLYHYVQERGKVAVRPVTGDTAFGPYTGPVYVRTQDSSYYRFTIQVAEMGSVPPGYGVCIQYGAHGGTNSTNTCTCTPPVCDSGLGLWECIIPDHPTLHDVQVDWNISNREMSPLACSNISTQGPFDYFTTRPTAIKLESLSARSVSRDFRFGLSAFVLIAFGSILILKVSQRFSQP